MTKNIQDKIDEIFSDEYINNKRLLFSPKKLSQSKTYKNNDKNKDNRINATVKVEKSTETTNYRTSSSKTRKQHIKNINENPDGNKPILKALNDMEKNKENNLANEINDKKELKRELTLKIRQKKKEEKEEKEKQEKEKQEKEKQEKEKRERKEKEKEKKEKEKREKEKKEKEKKEKEKQEKEKQEKEKEEKKDDKDDKKELNIDDEDFPISRYQSRRGRGKSHHIKSKMEVFKGILNKDLKKKKKSKVEFDDIINIKEKIEEENNLSDEKNNKDKDKGKVKPKDKDKDKDKEKLKNRTYSVVKKKKSICLKGDALNKIRGNIIESKIEINKENDNNNSLLKINSKSPKLKHKKGPKIMSTTKNFYHKNTKGESINSNIHLSQKKCSHAKSKKGSKLLGKKNSFNASIIFSNNDADSNNSIGSLANGKENKNNEDKKDIIDFKISDSSDFKSSNDSDKKPEQKTEQKSNYKRNKSSKCIDSFGTNKKISKRESKKNISHKKIDYDNNNNKDEKKKNKSNKKLKMDGNKEYISKKEEISSAYKLQSRDSSKYLKNNIHKFDSRISNIKPLKMEPIYNSDIKKVKNKRKIVFPSQYPISNKVSNLLIANGKENNNNLYENINNNMNIINPGTFISIEYNLSNSKKDTKHLDDNHNDLLINNNEKKSFFKKENKENYKSSSKRDIHENNQSSLIKEIHDNNDSETQNNQKIKEYNDNNNVSNSNNNPVIYKNTKNTKCFCCL